MQEWTILEYNERGAMSAAARGMRLAGDEARIAAGRTGERRTLDITSHSVHNTCAYNE